MKKLLTNCLVVPGPGDEVIKNAYLAINDGEIKSIGRLVRLPDKYKQWSRENLGGDLVIPGLINTHTHVPMALLRGWAEDLSLDKWLQRTRRYREKFYTEEVARLSVRLALAELIKSGVTTFADMSVNQALHLDIVRQSGLRAVLFETLMEYVYPDNCSKLLDFLNSTRQEGLVYRGAALHAPYSSNGEIFEWFKTEIKEKYDPRTSIHLAETGEEIEICRKRFECRPVEILRRFELLDERLLAIHGVFLEEDELELLAGRDVKLSHNPECNMKIGAGVPPVVKALQSGLTVALGTDSQASNNDQDMFGEMRSAAYLQKVACRDPRVLPARRVYEMVTTAAAEAVGLPDKIGRLREGKAADLAVIDFNQVSLRPVYDPLSLIIYSINASDVKNTMVAGRWLMKDRELLTFDETKIINRVEEQQEQNAKADY